MSASRILGAALLALTFVTSGVASAATFTANYTVTANTTDPGLVVDVNPSAASFTRHLEVGESAHINLFRIWTNEAAVNHDDKAPKPISVAFDFTSPDHFGGTATGSTEGRSFLYGLVQDGKLTWDGPLVLGFGQGNTGKATLTLADVVFNKGLFGLHEGYKYGADVHAKLRYDMAPVPLPAALPLLAAGLGLIGFVAARRRV
jgi:hypothetical protein